MPLPVLLTFAFSVGAVAAACADTELRVSPRPAFLTQGFLAHLIFDVLVVLPVATYFYAFHGDWFLLYSMDTRRVPSALALLALSLFIGGGALGFVSGASLVRSQKLGAAVALAAASLALGGGVAFGLRDRLTQVGTFAQFAGQFGLKAFGETPLFEGAVVMAPLLIAGALFLCVRIYVSGRR
jgi:hypothetical protein